MKNVDVLNTLFVGIDVGSQTNSVYATDFCGERTFRLKAIDNNQPGTVSLMQKIESFMKEKQFSGLILAMESTSIYSTHLATFLGSFHA